MQSVFLRRLCALCAVAGLSGMGIALLSVPATASAQIADQAEEQDDFRQFAQILGEEALRRGVTKATVDAVIPTLTLNPKVLALDKNQPGGGIATPVPPFEPYLRSHVTSQKIAQGRAVYNRLRPLLAQIEAETGVPESVMVAIYGHETGYGSFAGDFDLARSLASLAYEGRRRPLFTDEFIATLKLMDKGFPRYKLVGSWAGATGYPQFLPSVYLRLGKDGDGDGIIDIWTNEADAVASIGNYLMQAGWNRALPWGMQVRVPDSLDRQQISPITLPSRCAPVHARHSRWLTMKQWRELGVEPVGHRIVPDDTQATLIEPDGPAEPAYLTTVNYRAILDYNCSNFYALTVGLLADAVER